MTKAIVTLATGAYRELWEAYAAPTWQAFCDCRGYELVALHEPIDTSERAAGRSMAWQKLKRHTSQSRAAEPDLEALWDAKCAPPAGGTPCTRVKRLSSCCLWLLVVACVVCVVVVAAVVV